MRCASYRIPAPNAAPYLQVAGARGGEYMLRVDAARRMSPARAVSLTETSATYAPSVGVSSGAIQFRRTLCADRD